MPPWLSFSNTLEKIDLSIELVPIYSKEHEVVVIEIAAVSASSLLFRNYELEIRHYVLDLEQTIHPKLLPEKYPSVN